MLNYYAEEDRQGIAEDYRIFLEALNQSVALSQQIESAFEQLIGQIRNRGFRHVREVARGLSEIAQQFFHLQDLKGFQKPFRSNHPFRKHLPALQENFRYEQTIAFFKDFLDRLLGDSVTSATSPYRLPISNFKRLFEYVLEMYFQGKAVFVNNSRQGQIMPLWVSLDRGKTSEHVKFWNQDIDDVMQASADTARRVARDYLHHEWGQDLPEKMSVQCQFPRFDASLKDTSASLFIGIRIVGEVLGIKSKPATVVTGEVETSGDIRGVGFINEKIEAASKHEGIDGILPRKL